MTILFCLLTMLFSFSCKSDDNEIKLSITCPDNKHPHMIDLGLPSGTKWACCNVDTNNPENQAPTNYGGYYSWGETEEKDFYDWSNYLYRDKYGKYLDLGNDISGTEFDVAHAKWGGSWRMPSVDQIDELIDNCSWTWTTQYGLNGQFVIGPNGGTIFLPAAGIRWDYKLGDIGLNGSYWASSLGTGRTHLSNEFLVSCLFFQSSSWFSTEFSRDNGYSVRAVCQ